MLGKLFSRDNDTTGLSIVDWAKMFRPGAQVSYNGNRYQAFQVDQTAVPAATYYDSNSVVFACEANRLLLFSEARFQYQRMRNGRPGDLFGDEKLARIEEPWPGASTRDLLVQAELDVATCGNSYWVRDEAGFLRLEPSKVKLFTQGVYDNDVTGFQVGERLLAYAYMVERDRAVLFNPEEVGHYKPYPLRQNRFLGMSWLSPCLPDIDADVALTEHKRTAVHNGAQLGYVISVDPTLSDEQFEFAVESYRRQHEGPENAGKTLFISGGTDVKTVGQTFEDLSMKATQGAGETRIAACAGVPPVIVGLSEGLSSATYSNYAQARRRLVDGTMRPLWGFFAASMQSLFDVPSDARLWYDDRDIPFLREDVKDQAEILTADAGTLVNLVSGGFDPDAAIDAVKSGDLSRLAGKHSGLYSVQLQPPGLATGQQELTE
jgi:Phage portal protein